METLRDNHAAAAGFQALPCLSLTLSLAFEPLNSKKSGENPMARLKFGAFLAPHHPIGEHPMLQFRRDLDFVEQIDALGFDEFWCGEHHSSGWETIASPEMFLAAAGERTKMSPSLEIDLPEQPVQRGSRASAPAFPRP